MDESPPSLVASSSSSSSSSSLLPHEYPTATSIPFPYPQLYPPQRELMDALLQGIQPTSTNTYPSSTGTPSTTTRLLLLESPTGTGKSLSLACASLAWLDFMHSTGGATTGDNTNATTSTNSTTTTTTSGSINTRPTTTTGLSWLDDWQAPESTDPQHHQQQLQEQAMELDRQTRLEVSLNTIRSQITTSCKNNDNSNNSNHREQRLNILRQEMTKAQLQARKRQKQQQQQTDGRKGTKRPRPIPILEYEHSDDDEPKQLQGSSTNNNNKSIRTPPYGTAEWLLHRGRTTTPTTTITSSTTNTTTSTIPYKIIYAARTHSQLSQFIGEVQRTHWGTTVRVVTVASRSQGLCGYLTKRSPAGTHASVLSEAALTEHCHDLRNTAAPKTAIPKKSSCACPYYQSSAMATLAVHSLAYPLDLEDMVHLGNSTQTCAYYATRQAVPHAQLIVLPYTLLIDKQARQAIGLDLTNSLVIIDEAHNLPAAIQAATCSKVSLLVLQASQKQLERYTQKYLDQLSSIHIKLLGQLKVVLKGLEQSLIQLKHSPPQLPLQQPNSADRTNRGSTKTLQSISQFLCVHKLESINLFPILRYLHDSRLSQKLMGFMDPKTTTTTKQSTKQSNNHLDDHILPVVDTSATVATVSSSLPSHISPMSIVETFLEKLNTYDPTHAKLVVTPHESLELVVLNPSVHAQDDLYSKPHALCLVGGTLQPFSVLVQELVPQLSHHASQAQAHILNYQQQKQQQERGTDDYTTNKSPTSACYKAEQLIGFSCGHVVDKDHVLLQYLAHVNSTKLDLVHGSRSQSHILHAIGSAIFSICQTIPYGGIVIFVPSYSYEQVLVEAWQRLAMNRDDDHVGPPPLDDLGMTTATTTTTSIWNAINQVKRIYREPKNRNHLEATLRDFSHEAQSPTGGGGGALLIAVVGGKLSEGINFANDLCRCVVMVGLPYADKLDPILQEKLRYIANPQQYYQSLCLRAVNQSVGRAIRHAKDYAAIVVMDPRYARDDAIAHGLPQWLTASTPSWRSQDGRLETVTQNLTRFFQNPKFQRERPQDG